MRVPPRSKAHQLKPTAKETSLENRQASNCRENSQKPVIKSIEGSSPPEATAQNAFSLRLEE